MYSKKCRTKNGALGNSNIKFIFLWRFPIQNQPKPSITEKRRHKAKCLTWHFIRLKFVKKTRMPNLVKCLEYITCYSSSNLRPDKNPSNSIRYNYQKICTCSRRPKTIVEIRKKTTFLQVINNPITYKFFREKLFKKFLKDFNIHRKTTNRPVVFSCSDYVHAKNLKYPDIWLHERHTLPNPTKSGTNKCYLPLMIISMQRNWDINSFPKYWWSKNLAIRLNERRNCTYTTKTSSLQSYLTLTTISM